MEPVTLYVARLVCGCVVGVCTSFDDEDLWLYSARGNGWAVEHVERGQEIREFCTEFVKPLEQTRMF